MTTDPIADYLTRIRNAIHAKHSIVEIPASKTKTKLTEVLQEKGYICGYKVVPNGVQPIIKIALKYDTFTKQSAIVKLTRVSKPGLRKYATVAAMPSVINGLGIAILSTSKGIMTDKEARKAHVGGEVLCYVY
ncbi:MAG: 30S ribosomal protein S8 [Candidatus Cardinium sp.]|uniref:30S ribosomal protein S8 n=1 Tax=Cardinium endosymbiont of Dermatophagoides farinae TaxID=2597823 RepID=UPI001183DB0E|nr:30S ribosomal protein S8 [Cardinium endosymbiont of Dermatophagoides farinae]TSJ81199.1 30S ribosomal protein S8 [Cardinium endosymbiont of Dermatophagoides farinae]UWW97247.1 MAG: 30S ribosomal protein S8 [Candidatus Cardinium sp.]